MITAKSGFRPELESLRGLAALAVAGFHIGQSPTIIKGVATHLIPFGVAGGNDWQSPANLIFKVAFPGHASVLFFFVLSGFVLIASLERSTRSIPEAASVFLVSRIFRIYPAWIFAICLISSISVLTGASMGRGADISTSEFVFNILLLSVSLDGVGWSLQTELLAIPIIFLAFFLLRNQQRALFVLIVLVSLALANTTRNYLALPGGPPRGGLLFCFLVGIFAYTVCKKVKIRSGFLFAASLILFLCSPIAFADAYNGLNICASITAALMIVGASYGSNESSNILCRNRVIRFFGRISFSFYLLHPITLIVFWQIPNVLGGMIEVGVPSVVVALLAFSASVLIITPIAAFSEKYIERPFVSLGKRLSTAPFSPKPLTENTRS